MNMYALQNYLRIPMLYVHHWLFSYYHFCVMFTGIEVSF